MNVSQGTNCRSCREANYWLQLCLISSLDYLIDTNGGNILGKLLKEKIMFTVIGLLFLMAFFVSVSAQNSSKFPPVLVLDVQQNADTVFVSPVVVYRNGRFEPAYDKAKGDLPRRRFVEKYFATGKSYYLIVGGGNAGTLKIKDGYWQDGSYAYAELQPDEPGRIHGQLHALATDYDTSARGSGFRRAPTAEERTAAIDLARAAFSEHQVPSNLLAKMEVLNLTALDTDGDNKAELVGSFKVPREKKDSPPHLLFLIAEGEGANYKAARVNYQFNPNQSEYPLGLEMLSDNLDIDGDGFNEIVTVSTGPAFVDSFVVYQKKAGKWNKVFSGGGAH
jgi:hypothetical protein